MVTALKPAKPKDMLVQLREMAPGEIRIIRFCRVKRYSGKMSHAYKMLGRNIPVGADVKIAMHLAQCGC